MGTPRAVVDKARVARNCRRMLAIARTHGVALRPHAKTSKCLEVVEQALGDQASRSITVSTLAEARWFAERGIQDMTYAVGITPAKLAEVSQIRQRGIELNIITDSLAVARALVSDTATQRVFVEIDCGDHRSGVAPDSPELLHIGKLLDGASHVELAGVLTHAGQSYQCRTVDEVVLVAEQERLAAVHAAKRLQEAGLACPEVSVGSTPTAIHAKTLEGVSEIRPGVYMFFDLFQAAIGSCTTEDIALSVVASVISKRDDCVWIDAGALALSSDRSLDRVGGDGYGLVTALDGRALPSHPRVVGLHQEHGRVVGDQGTSLGLEVGDLVRVWPNHACMTAAMYDGYVVEEAGEEVGYWPRLRG